MTWSSYRRGKKKGRKHAKVVGKNRAQWERENEADRLGKRLGLIGHEGEKSSA